ncbi:ABC transporter permease [Nesterenkonia populi]|uniref:ABC transporter permease n=1 Tax=Nesterenkonia populi TaxID=1591087 RepID=UPI001FEAFF2B|nr:ABC transporter permease [Nesterenkonia populi]
MNWALNNFSRLMELFWEHTVLATIPTVLGLLIAVPLGLLLNDGRSGRRIAVALASVAFTIPSLALFVTIPTLIGTQILDPINVIAALTLYSAALTLRSVFDSLDAVDSSVRDAAQASGFSRLSRAVFVDLPLAVPVLTAGLRVACATNVSLVSVGAVIGVGGLGELFTSGYQRSYPDQIFAGILAIMVLAFILDRLIAAAGWLLTPWERAHAG